MASALYNFARELFLNGDIDWTSDDIRVILVDTADYTFSQTHNYLDDVEGAARVATSSALSGKTTTDGVADASDVSISGVSGDQFEAIIIYKHTGTEGTSPLIAYIDDYTGIPTTPNGSSITIAWPGDSNKIFKL
jgi:hypothetical protein